MRKLFVSFALVIGFITAQANASSSQTNAVYFLGGMVRTSGTDDPSFSLQYEYLMGLGKHFDFSISYLNEGHFPDDHRDGIACQFWAGTSLLDRRLFLSAGIGPYLYFDTTRESSSSPYRDTHEFGFEGSLAATWHLHNRWHLRLRANWIETADLDTLSVLLGIGYEFDSLPLPGMPGELAAEPVKTAQNEITAFAGQAIVNSFGSEISFVMGVEYRRNLLRYLDWTIAWFDEGDSEMIDRNGVISQLWVAKRFNDSACLGLGGGAYQARDDYHGQLHEGKGSKTVAGVITLTGRYRLLSNLAVRLSWSRIITDYNRDTDLIMCGIGYSY